ncbi:molybdopterin-dependent oxidoreductase, partial [Enterobacter hormaechei]
LAEEILGEGEGQVRALVTVAGNPVLSTPNGRRLEQALDGLEFMLSIDLYINETTRYADLILPPTAPLEHDHYDTTF